MTKDHYTKEYIDEKGIQNKGMDSWPVCLTDSELAAVNVGNEAVRKAVNVALSRLGQVQSRQQLLYGSASFSMSRQYRNDRKVIIDALLQKIDEIYSRKG